MKVRRISPICKAFKTAEGMAFVKYKGALHPVKADYVLELPDGSTVPFRDLTGFRIVQEEPLMVQQIHPIEEAVKWDKHGDHHLVRRLNKHERDRFSSEGKDPDTHGVMVNHAGHDNDIHPGDFVIGNPGLEIRRLAKDMKLYEVIEQ